MRRTVTENFPKAPGLPKDKGAYLHFIDGIYKSDAYHSLSIEGYSVTPALIERVRRVPDHHEDDRKSRDALAGYRDSPVYLRTSRYVPPRWEAVRDAMPAYFDLLENEAEPGVRAVLGHWLFGYIHPYSDGNGRMARFLMNVMLASGGYSWTVIRVRDRNAYLSALDRASIDMNIKPLARFVAERARWSLEQHDLTFPESDESYIADRLVVMFSGMDGKTRVRCAISREALDDHFKGDGRDKLEVFRKHRKTIEEEARRKYLAGDTEVDGSILVRTGDLG